MVSFHRVHVELYWLHFWIEYIWWSCCVAVMHVCFDRTLMPSAGTRKISMKITENVQVQFSSSKSIRYVCLGPHKGAYSEWVSEYGLMSHPRHSIGHFGDGLEHSPDFLALLMKGQFVPRFGKVWLRLCYVYVGGHRCCQYSVAGSTDGPSLGVSRHDWLYGRRAWHPQCPPRYCGWLRPSATSRLLDRWWAAQHSQSFSRRHRFLFLLLFVILFSKQ